MSDTLSLVPGGRNAENIPYFMRGSYVAISGEILTVVKNNPYTYSRKPFRQRRYLLKPVFLAGIEYDHLWLPCCKKISHLRVGDYISFFARLSTYVDKPLNSEGEEKWCCKFPYDQIKTIRR